MELLELDYAILGVLPEEGTKLGVTELAKQTRAIERDVNEAQPEGAPHVTSAQINGRLRVLHLDNLVASRTVQPVAKGKGWQRTPKGRRLCEEHSAEDGLTIPENLEV